METVVTAPVLGDISPSQKSRSTKNPRKLKAVNQQINKGFKNNERQKNPFDNEAVKAWKNPCNSIGYITPIYNAQDIDKQSYNVSYQNVSEYSCKSLRLETYSYFFSKSSLHHID